jgi:hypothetical protein
MGHSKTSATRIKAAERRTQALALRRGGATFGQIAAFLGVSEARAHKIVTQQLQRLNKTRAESAAAVLRLELERLDGLFMALWPKARSGDGAAVDRVLAIMARRAKLLGLDAPEKRELSGSPGPARSAPPRVSGSDPATRRWSGGRV